MHADLVRGAGGIALGATGADGAPGHLDGCDPGGLSLRGADADSAGVDFARPLCGAAGRGGIADADLRAGYPAGGSARPRPAARGSGNRRAGGVVFADMVADSTARRRADVHLRGNIRGIDDPLWAFKEPATFDSGAVYRRGVGYGQRGDSLVRAATGHAARNARPRERR